MIVSSDSDNSIEDHYFVVNDCDSIHLSINVSLPFEFYINSKNCNSWIIGWGNNKPYYDAGVENCRAIKSIDSKTGSVELGAIVRGKGFPRKQQRIVFWNKSPSGYLNRLIKPIVDSHIWPEFAGTSMFFGSVEFDSLQGKWMMLVNENDTSKIQIYAAQSNNLIEWKPANNAKPILTAGDFKNCRWAGVDKTGLIAQTAKVTDIVRYKNKWYLFLDGYDSKGKRNIGVAISEHSLLGPYSIADKPLLIPGYKGSWNDDAVFSAKVKRYKDGFILFYDGKNSAGAENIGMATSTDLIHWTNSFYNPVIVQHSGWRSSVLCTEPSCIEIHNDSIMLLIAGMKTFNTGFWNRYFSKGMFMGKSGNVDDTQLGMYLSTDGGKSFVAHSQNPVFTNDYSNKYENEHMGINVKKIVTDTADIIIYQAKSSFEGLKYNIMLRSKTKKNSH